MTENYTQFAERRFYTKTHRATQAKSLGDSLKTVRTVLKTIRNILKTVKTIDIIKEIWGGEFLLMISVVFTVFYIFLMVFRTVLNASPSDFACVARCVFV